MATNGFVDDVLELLAPLGQVHARAMFGGWSLYLGDGGAFGLIADERLFFKVDDLNRAQFEAAGGEPFVYDSGKGKPVQMSYWTPPPGTEDDKHAVQPWARLGIEAAARAQAKKAATKKTGAAKPAAKSASKKAGARKKK